MGSLFVLMAVGLTLTYAVSRVINFAHGELVTLGAYAAALAVNLSGLSLLPALVLGAAAGALAALTLDELIYKPLMARRASPLHPPDGPAGLAPLPAGRLHWRLHHPPAPHLPGGRRRRLAQHQSPGDGGSGRLRRLRRGDQPPPPGRAGRSGPFSAAPPFSHPEPHGQGHASPGRKP